jgi:hypothetical protein
VISKEIEENSLKFYQKITDKNSHWSKIVGTIEQENEEPDDSVPEIKEDVCRTSTIKTNRSDIPYAAEEDNIQDKNAEERSEASDDGIFGLNQSNAAELNKSKRYNKSDCIDQFKQSLIRFNDVNSKSSKYRQPVLLMYQNTNNLVVESDPVNNSCKAIDKEKFNQWLARISFKDLGRQTRTQIIKKKTNIKIMKDKYPIKYRFSVNIGIENVYEVTNKI